MIFFNCISFILWSRVIGCYCVHNYFVTALLNFSAAYFFLVKLVIKLEGHRALIWACQKNWVSQTLFRLEIVVWVLGCWILNHVCSLIHSNCWPVHMPLSLAV